VRAVGILEVDGQDRAEVRERAVRSAGSHEPGSEALERRFVAGVEGEVVDTSTVERRRPRCVEVGIGDLERVQDRTIAQPQHGVASTARAVRQDGTVDLEDVSVERSEPVEVSGDECDMVETADHPSIVLSISY
jgi:hypothetical protein